MLLRRIILACLSLICFVVMEGCKKSSHNHASGPSPAPAQTPSTTGGTTGTVANSAPTTPGANVVAISVDGDNCDSSIGEYPNEICTTVKICQHGTQNCQSISGILVDTGSTGLRIFNSLVTVQTEPVAVAGGSLAECLAYSGGSSDWGQVAMVDVILGNEAAVEVPIQLINASYSSPPSQCTPSQSTPDSSPSEAHLNGILGVSSMNQDCGSLCSSTVNNQQYYSCTGGTCTAVSTNTQVQNPVALLSQDNNGVVINLPSVAAGGAKSVEGTMYLGIGTQSNNTPGSGVQSYAISSDENTFYTVFSAYSQTAQASFIDSGSPLLVIPLVSGLVDCSTDSSNSYYGLFCPTSTLTFTAVNKAFTGSTQGTVSFTVANAEAVENSGNVVYSDVVQDLSIGGSLGDFDWGLPFFFGRAVYVGIEGTKSNQLGTGPYWGY